MHLVFLKCCVIIPTGFITQLRRVKKKWQSRVNFGPPAQNTPPPKPLSWPPTLMKRVSICLEFKHLSACIILMPNNAIPDELFGKNWFAHALALTTSLVHKHSLLTWLFFSRESNHNSEYMMLTARANPTLKSSACLQLQTLQGTFVYTQVL